MKFNSILTFKSYFPVQEDLYLQEIRERLQSALNS
jgi:hypothetical protein